MNASETMIQQRPKEEKEEKIYVRISVMNETHSVFVNV